MTYQQARDLFRQFNGSTFHMSREEPQLLAEFESLHISEAQKDIWRLELAQEHLAKIGQDNPRSWSLFSSLTSVLTAVKTVEGRQERMFLEAIEKQKDCDELTRIISLETICGRTYDYHDGVIAFFRKRGYDLAELKAVSDKLIEHDKNTDNQRFRKAITLYQSLI